MQYFLTSTGRAGCYVRKDKFDQRLASARSFAPRTVGGEKLPLDARIPFLARLDLPIVEMDQLPGMQQPAEMLQNGVAPRHVVVRVREKDPNRHAALLPPGASSSLRSRPTASHARAEPCP